MMTDRNSTTQDRFTTDEVIELLGIKKSAYYDRLNFLGIKARKDKGGKAYLDSEQVNLLKELQKHVEITGKMEGFEFSCVEDEELEIEDNSTESGGKLAVKGSSGLAASSNSSSQPDSIIEQSIPETQPNFSEGTEELFRKAAEIKAQGLALPDLVALQLAGQMTFDDLPTDLKEKVTAVREAASPKMNPASVASDLLAQYRASR